MIVLLSMMEEPDIHVLQPIRHPDLTYRGMANKSAENVSESEMMNSHIPSFFELVL